MRVMSDMRGKSVLVTGAARRLGRSMALAFAQAGADVAITYRTSERDARDTLAALKSKGVRALAIRADVRSESEMADAVDQVVGGFGGLDVLVNNAAVYETVQFEDITLEQWDRMFDTNTRGPFLATRVAAPALRKRKGRVINIGSLGGIRPWSTHAHYCASKAALVMLTQAMAKALAPEIAVNCVAPGMICTGDISNDEFATKIAAKTPMKRAGSPEDVNEAVLFLASSTHFITGQVFAVDGGLGLE